IWRASSPLAAFSTSKKRSRCSARRSRIRASSPTTNTRYANALPPRLAPSSLKESLEQFGLQGAGLAHQPLYEPSSAARVRSPGKGAILAGNVEPGDLSYQRFHGL